MNDILTESEMEVILSGEMAHLDCEGTQGETRANKEWLRERLQLAAQKGYEAGKKEERICQTCNGKGWFINPDADNNETIPCTKCNGHGFKNSFSCDNCKQNDTTFLELPRKLCPYCLKQELEQAKQEGYEKAKAEKDHKKRMDAETKGFHAGVNLAHLKIQEAMAKSTSLMCSNLLCKNKLEGWILCIDCWNEKVKLARQEGAQAERAKWKRAIPIVYLTPDVKKKLKEQG
jgi:hypothetical protein